MIIFQTKKSKVRDDKDGLRKYRIGPFTMLQFMALLAIFGLALTAVLYHFFG
jgi:hypothetical protein